MDLKLNSQGSSYKENGRERLQDKIQTEYTIIHISAQQPNETKVGSISLAVNLNFHFISYLFRLSGTSVTLSESLPQSTVPTFSHNFVKGKKTPTMYTSRVYFQSCNTSNYPSINLATYTCTHLHFSMIQKKNIYKSVMCYFEGTNST